MFLKQPKWTARNRMWESLNPTEDSIQPPSHPDGPCSLPLLRDRITQCYPLSIKAMEEQCLIKESIVSSCSQWQKKWGHYHWRLYHRWPKLPLLTSSQKWHVCEKNKTFWEFKWFCGEKAMGVTRLMLKALLVKRGIYSTGTEMGSENSSL